MSTETILFCVMMAIALAALGICFYGSDGGGEPHDCICHEYKPDCDCR